MKIEVDPHVLHDIAAYCDEQQATMDATREYLNQHGKIGSGSFGLLLQLARPFYELCRGATMDGFGLGAKLVKSRSVAMHAYIKEQEALESGHEDMLKKMADKLNNLERNLGSLGGGNAGAAGGSGGVRAPSFGGQTMPQEAEHAGSSRMNELNPQPLPPVDRASELNPQPLPPVDDPRLRHVDSELNPQPLPPGPPDELLHNRQVLGDQKVMDRVWQDRSANDPLGRSPQQLQSQWEARQPIAPPPAEQGIAGQVTSPQSMSQAMAAKLGQLFATGAAVNGKF